MMNKPLVICVEDNENDILIMKRIFNLKLKAYNFSFFNNVDKCIAFLNDALLEDKLPSLAIVDIKLINSNGLDLLEYIKEDNRLKHIPVVMLSSSDRKDDKKRAKDLKCNEYVEKPKNYLDLKKKLPEIIHTWSNN